MASTMCLIITRCAFSHEAKAWPTAGSVSVAYVSSIQESGIWCEGFGCSAVVVVFRRVVESRADLKHSVLPCCLAVQGRLKALSTVLLFGRPGPT